MSRLNPKRTLWAIAAAGLASVLDGCEMKGAPSFIIFGSYFPAWIFCAVIGVFGAIGVRLVMVGVGLSNVLPFQLFVCVAAGLVIALAAWLLWFGR